MIHPASPGCYSWCHCVTLSETLLNMTARPLKPTAIQSKRFRLWNGQGEPNKNFMVTLLIMDEDSTIHPITASKKNPEEHINEI